MDNLAAPQYRRVSEYGEFIEVVEYMDTEFGGFAQKPKGERKRGLVEAKRDDHIRAAHARARMLVMANANVNDTYFFTATFREQVKDFDAAVAAWERFRRILVSEFPKVRYLAIPELHKSGAWHFHAVLCGLPDHKEIAKLGEGWWRNGNGNMVPGHFRFFTEMWSRANGHSGDFGDDDRINIQPLRKVGGAAWYVAKYITKETSAVVPLGRRMYFAGGKGLRRAKVVKEHSWNLQVQKTVEGVKERMTMVRLGAFAPPKGAVAEYGVSRRKGEYGRVSFTRYKKMGG